MPPAHPPHTMSVCPAIPVQTWSNCSTLAPIAGSKARCRPYGWTVIVITNDPRPTASPST